MVFSFYFTFTVIREWSILAIRNLCDENVENQQIIAGLTKIDNAENPILVDNRMDDGSIRIQPK